MKIAVLGASGYVGSRLVPHLQAKGWQVRCLVRNPDKTALTGAEIIVGDATDNRAVERVLDDVDRIVYLIHSMDQGAGKFEQLDRQIAENVADVASRVGVKQIVYLGGLGKRGESQSAHLRSRHTVAELLRSTGTPVTEFRAGVVVGAGSTSFEMIRFLVSRLPVMICPRWVKVKTQPIAVDDVLDYIGRSLVTPAALGETIDIGGPDILSYRDMMLTVARQLGHRRLIIPVPVLTPQLSSHWVNLVTPIGAPLARALIESVRSETICDNDRALSMFDIRPMSFDDAVSDALHGGTPSDTALSYKP